MLFSLPCTLRSGDVLDPVEGARTKALRFWERINCTSLSLTLPLSLSSQSALITPFVRGAFSLDREEEEEDHGWEEWISDDRGKHLFGIIGMRRARRGSRRGARDSHTLQICGGGASGRRSFSFKHQREFAQNATRLPSFFGRVLPLALCDAE